MDEVNNELGVKMNCTNAQDHVGPEERKQWNYQRINQSATSQMWTQHCTQADDDSFSKTEHQETEHVSR